MSTLTFPRVLVTGANSFYAAAIMDYLFKHYPGTQVHAAVRNQRSVAHLEARYGSAIKVFIVPDITTSTAFHESVRGCSAIFHVASPLATSFTSAKSQMLDPAINGARTALAAAAAEPGVKRVVLTSSCGALMNPLHPDGYMRPGYTYTEADRWSDLSYERACGFTTFTNAYQASKSLAERGAWAFMQEAPRHFDLVSLCPGTTIGSYGQPVTSPENMNMTNLVLSQLMDGKRTEVPSTMMPCVVSVEDVAQAHVKALYVPEAGGQRFIVSAAPYDAQEVVDVMHERFQGADWLKGVPKGNPGTFKPRDNHFALDNTRSREVLGVEYAPWQDAVEAFCKQYVEDKKKWTLA